ncbi:MAG: phytanoyl-CoA dioxygenase [Anaerolineaceae bacterium]|nr:phytanoyl-CoA dioxygenase [Anaerolineaceae bacterium]
MSPIPSPFATVPSTNADGLPVTPWTEEQKYLFDTRGWLAIPGVLDEADIEEMREFCYRLENEPDSLSPSERSTVGGPLQKLVDHPVVVGFMNEFVAHAPLASEDCYGFRLEGSFLALRPPGHDNFRPHGGRGMLNFPGNSHTYHVTDGRVSSGLTRVVWELAPVKHGQGGTLFMTGSHKAAFDSPASASDMNSPLWETYECPAGSVLFFTEAIRHTGAVWSNTDNDRVAIFHCYNTVGNKWHKWEPQAEVLAAMPPKRQTLFRPVYVQDNLVKNG